MSDLSDLYNAKIIAKWERRHTAKIDEAVAQLIAAASSVRARLDPPTQEESMKRVKALDDALSNLRKELE